MRTNLSEGKNVSSRVEEITPQMAREYLKYNKSNRPLRKATVEYYAEIIKKGQWKLNGESICFLKDGSLSNGQHRLNAIILAGKSITSLVVRGCDNDSFVTYDSGRNRTISDVFALSSVNNYAKISSAVNRYFLLKNNQTTIGTKRRSIKSMRITKEDLLKEYYESEELYQRAARKVSTWSDKIKLFNESEITGFYVYAVKILGHSEPIVYTFLDALYSNKDVPNTTISILREKIIKDKFRNSSMTGEYKSALFAKVWNAYISHKTLKVLSWNKEKEGKINFI